MSYQYICHDCAYKALKGNKAPDDCYTIHIGVCEKCKENKGIAHTTDFGLTSALQFRSYIRPLD